MTKDIKLICTYLHRFLEGPVISRQKIAAFGRYAGSAVSLIFERIYGLDYNMVYDTKYESTHHSVYTKAPKKVLKRVFDDLPDDKSKMGFFDVGCGKGYVVTVANRYGFEKVGGVEYTKPLYHICCSNLKKKNLSAEYVFNGDAKEFEHYGEFDVFFFNNPFDETILEPVANKIFETHIGRRCYLYFLNPDMKERTDAIEKAGFLYLKQLTDPNEWYFNINVYINERYE